MRYSASWRLRLPGPPRYSCAPPLRSRWFVLAGGAFLVLSLALAWLGLAGAQRSGIAGFDRTNLIYHVVPTRTQQDKDRIAVDLLRNAEGTSVVYAPTRKAVERVASERRSARSHRAREELDEYVRVR